MADRREFTAATRKAALKRSNMRCEAVGEWYGLGPGQRCHAGLAHGVEYDHIVLDANSKDNSLENCAAVCIKCHRFKSANHDTPMAAKTVRQSLMGMKTRPKAKIAQRFQPAKSKPQKLPTPPRRAMFRKEASQ
ncbi:MAG: HNH endonuclease [Mesorhizobium sp.]|nr:MAG: HNH endonuclease [Mesorhizobium sp.]